MWEGVALHVKVGAVFALGDGAWLVQTLTWAWLFHAWPLPIEDADLVGGVGGA